MIESGGNARLRILRELYHETGDDVFNRLDCLFVPWRSESKVLAAHLIENELRGDMTLIDKAYAIRDLKAQLEEEREAAFASRSEFIRTAKSMGYQISRRHAIRFEYALKLDQMIPEILREGLGGHKIDEIKNTENAYLVYCEQQGKKDAFAGLFAHIMSENDGEDWDFEVVRRQLDYRLAELLDIAFNRLRIEVDSLLFKNTAFGPKASQEFDFSEANAKKAAKTAVPVDSSGEHEETALSPNIDMGQDDALQEIIVDDREDQSNSYSGDARNPDTLKQEVSPDFEPESGVVVKTAGSTGVPALRDLKSLRARAFVLALRLAKSAGLDYCVQQIQNGMGFIVDLPAKEDNLHDKENPGAFYLVPYTVWWFLVGAARQGVEDYVYIISDTRMMKSPDEMLELVGETPDIVCFAEYLLRYNDQSAQLSERDFSVMGELMTTLRMINQFPENKVWKPITSGTGE